LRNVKELDGNELFDVLFIISPILPILVDSELIQAQIFKRYNKKTNNARMIYLNEAKKQNPDETKMNDALMTIEEEQANIFIRDTTKIIPQLLSNENRSIVFQVLAIFEKNTPEDISHYPGVKITTMLNEIIADLNFKDFLSYTEPSERIES